MNHRSRSIARFIVHVLVIFILSYLLTSCAQMLPLTGGDKDVDPPKVLKQSPENKTTSFTGNEIRIEFDEYIQVKDIQNQLIITPRLEKTPDVKVSSKSLLLKFNEPLAQNTTYNLNFGSSIADVHEGNVLAEFSVIFSTGTFIDSFYVEGNITDAYSKKPVADISVMLYANGNDSSMYKDKPHYFSKTDAAGNYKIKNIHAGKYKIAAIGDKNKNFTYEQGEETAAAKKELITIDSSAKINFEVFKEEPLKFFVKRTIYPFYGRAIFTFNKPFTGGLRPSPGTTEKFKYHFNEGMDSLHLMYNRGGKDTLELLLLGPDDRLTEKLLLAKQDNEKYEKDLKSGKFKPRVNGISQQKSFDRIYFSTTNIFSSGSITTKDSGDIDPTRILFVQEKDTTRFKFPVTARKGVYALSVDKPMSGKGEFIFYPGAFTGYEKTLNDTMRMSYEWKTKEDMGTVILSPSVKEKGKYVVELLNERGGVIEKKNIDADGITEEKFTFEGLAPGNYSLRMFKDENEDGKWTTGSLLDERSPEKIFYYDKPIKLLADWELNITWIIE